MLCNIYFEYIDSSCKYSFKIVASAVDLDYWNIRQWRKLYLQLHKEKQKYKDTLQNVSLKISPIETDFLSQPPSDIQQVYPTSSDS